MKRLAEFFPLNKRGPEHFQATFEEKGLAEIVKLQKAQVRYLIIFVIFAVCLCVCLCINMPI
jgi:hypothetical protein